MFEKFADEILPRIVFKIPIIWLIHHNVTTSHRNDNDRYVMLINEHDMISLAWFCQTALLGPLKVVEYRQQQFP